MKSGPLAGLRFIEFVGIGPGPLAAMILSDLGAEVIRIDRLIHAEPGIAGLDRHEFEFSGRGRQSLAVDLKKPEGVALVLDLVARADGLIEGFRPGVMERLGLGPEPCLSANPRLAYGRLTGWGQGGPCAQLAGHDLSYIALTGVLDMIGREDSGPVPPLNLIGDYAGGSLFMVVGILAAVISARTTGKGQVIDAAMVDGVAVMMTPLLGMMAAGVLCRGRGRNILDSGAPYYDTYICADGGYIAISPIEKRFRRLLLEGLELDPDAFPDVSSPDNWPAARKILAARIVTRSRDEWAEVFADSDACVAPVLTPQEAPGHPHLKQRGVYVEVGGRMQPAPAPRFSATPCGIPTPTQDRGRATLDAWGIAAERLAALRQAGMVL